jgi:amino acid transporter
MLQRLKTLFIGGPKDPLAHDIFHQLALAAFLAWAGLGADGLSSSSYGPEEAMRALGGHHHLALYLALATAFTVFIISASYAQIIELFPTGGGGYTVATRLLGERAGLASGSALVVDYVLTVSISVAAASDAIFSNLPPEWGAHRLQLALVLCVLLTWLNLRGLKESIKSLLPIFLVFVATHILLIAAGVVMHAGELPGLVGATLEETHAVASGPAGWSGLALLLMTAYSMGGGTYTGIEAVANGLGNLAEPRVRTGKRTMLLMATSLAFTAGGILFCYMLWRTDAVEGQTMNAVLIKQVFGNWPGGAVIGNITLWSEALLLVIAAQAGFVDGPNVLSVMAVDRWVPHRFANLSDRLVRQNGILLMGAAAFAILIGTGGQVGLLVVLYSINVFITFSLSQLSMCRHWWQERRAGRDWQHGLAINALGLGLTSSILVMTTIIKFRQGGWVTLALTGCIIGLCLLIRRHYNGTGEALKRLDSLLEIPLPEASADAQLAPEPEGPTAVLLVSSYGGLGIHAIFSIRKLFRDHGFKNLVFAQVGRIDAGRFRGSAEMEELRQHVSEDLRRWEALGQRMGYRTESHGAYGIDVPAELERVCEKLADRFVEPVFFSAKLVFAKETFTNRILHNQTSLEIQRRLLFRGLNTVVLPIRVL